MKKSKKLNINQQAAWYISLKNDDSFAKCYRSLLKEYQSTLDYWSTTTYMANSHDIQTLFDDALTKTLDVIERDGGDFANYFNNSLHNGFKTLLRTLKTRRHREQYETANDDEAATYRFEVADEFNLEEYVSTKITAKKKADQRQLIDFLLNGADATTTAIVEAFLAHPKPTATAIAKELGFHHSKVTRALQRLAAKHSTKQFGNHHDYLIAL